MSQISLPVGILISPFIEKISQWMFLETLRTSHDHYLEWMGIFGDWDKVSDTIEVSIYSPNVLDNNKPPLAKIAIKTTNDLEIDVIELLVEGKCGHLKYQDTLKVHNVGPIPTIISIPSIPLRSFYIDKDGGYFPTLKTISIQRLDEEQGKTPMKAIVQYSDTELLNDRFIKKWDLYWNMRAIDHAYHNIQAKLRYYLIQPKVLYGHSSMVPKKEVAKGILRFFIGKPLYYLLSRKIVLSTYFWVPIILRLRKFEIDNC